MLIFYDRKHEKIHQVSFEAEKHRMMRAVGTNRQPVSGFEFPLANRTYVWYYGFAEKKQAASDRETEDKE